MKKNNKREGLLSFIIYLMCKEDDPLHSLRLVRIKSDGYKVDVDHYCASGDGNTSGDATQ